MIQLQATNVKEKALDVLSYTTKKKAKKSFKLSVNWIDVNDLSRNVFMEIVALTPESKQVFFFSLDSLKFLEKRKLDESFVAQICHIGGFCFFFFIAHFYTVNKPYSHIWTTAHAIADFGNSTHDFPRNTTSCKSIRILFYYYYFFHFVWLPYFCYKVKRAAKRVCQFIKYFVRSWTDQWTFKSK